MFTAISKEAPRASVHHYTEHMREIPPIRVHTHCDFSSAFHKERWRFWLKECSCCGQVMFWLFKGESPFPSYPSYLLFLQCDTFHPYFVLIINHNFPKGFIEDQDQNLKYLGLVGLVDLMKVLYCTVLYCTVLYCTVLYCTALYCTILCCTLLNCTVLCCTVLFYAVLYCTVLSYFILIASCRFSYLIYPVINFL